MALLPTQFSDLLKQEPMKLEGSHKASNGRCSYLPKDFRIPYSMTPKTDG